MFYTKNIVGPNGRRLVEWYFKDQRELKDFLTRELSFFKGDENEVILLSLVRATKTIGFFSQTDRICVAISRARCALYIFGNRVVYAAASEKWKVRFFTFKVRIVEIAYGGVLQRHLFICSHTAKIILKICSRLCFELAFLCLHTLLHVNSQKR